MIKTTGKEYFYNVSGLMTPKYMISESLENDIEDFIDWVSRNTGALEAGAESQFKLNRAAAIQSTVESLYVMLCDINAHWLELEAARILRLADTGEHELCQKLIEPFISNVRTLAIDIQMAQSKKDGASRRHPGNGKIESCTYIINSMKTICRLLKNSDFEKALDLAGSIDELQESEYAIPFMSSIGSKDLEQAENLAKDIISVYSRQIEGVISSVTETVTLKRLLIVDDMPEILTTISLMLKDYYQVFAFSSGREALSSIDKARPDAFLLDIDMPLMDGFMLAKRIRAIPRYKDTPLLFLTGISNRETIVKSLQYGAKAFIVKPADKNIILSKLSGCFNQAS